jgi:hypothetical protein
MLEPRPIRFPPIEYDPVMDGIDFEDANDDDEDTDQ